MRCIEVSPKGRRLRRLTVGVVVGVLGISLASSVASAFDPPPNDPTQLQTSVQICHVTPGNIVANMPSVEGDVSGHADHENDIIPPFWFDDGGTPTSFPGLNWDADGQAIFANDCQEVDSTTTAVPTTAVPTTAAPTTAAPTTAAPTTEPPPTSAGETTTTTSTPPTTAGPTTTSGGATTAPVDSTLPPTGASTNANLIGAAVLLALGGGIALVVARRKTA